MVSISLEGVCAVLTAFIGGVAWLVRVSMATKTLRKDLDACQQWHTHKTDQMDQKLDKLLEEVAQLKGIMTQLNGGKKR